MAQSKTVTLKMGIDIRRAKTGSEAYSRLLLKMAQDTARANRAMTGLGGGAEKTGKKTEEAGKKIRKTAQSADVYTTAMKAGIFASQGFANSAITAISSISGLGAALLIVSGALAKFSKQSVDAFGDFEAKLGATARVLGIAGEEAQRLGIGFRELAPQVAVSAGELAQIGQEVGRLGIRGTENILNFTKAVSQLAKVSDLTGPQAATQLGRIIQISKDIDVSQIKGLASAVRAAAVTAATTESEILRTTLEITKAGAAFDLPVKFALALATGLREVGVTAELTRSATVALLVDVAGAAGGSLEKLQAWTNALGISGEELNKLVKTDVKGFFRLFAQRAGEAGDQLQPFLASIDETFVSRRVFPTISALVRQQGKIFNELEAAVEEQLTEGGQRLEKDITDSLSEVNNQAFNSKEAFEDLKRSIGEAVAPSVIEVYKDLQATIGELKLDPEFVKGWTIIGKAAVALAALGAKGAIAGAEAASSIARGAQGGLSSGAFPGQSAVSGQFRQFGASIDDALRGTFLGSLLGYGPADLPAQENPAQTAYERFRENLAAETGKTVSIAQESGEAIVEAIAEGIQKKSAEELDEELIDNLLEDFLKGAQERAPKKLRLFPGLEKSLEALTDIEAVTPSAISRRPEAQAELRDLFGEQVQGQISKFKDQITDATITADKARDVFNQIRLASEGLGGEFKDQIPTLESLTNAYLKFLESPEFRLKRTLKLLENVREFSGVAGQIQAAITQFERDSPAATRSDEDEEIFRTRLREAFAPRVTNQVDEFFEAINRGNMSLVELQQRTAAAVFSIEQIGGEGSEELKKRILESSAAYEDLLARFQDPVVAESMNLATQSVSDFASTLADSLVEGEFNFESFADSILKSVLEMILRLQVLLPLFEALKGQGGVFGQIGSAVVQGIGGGIVQTPGANTIGGGGSPLMIGSPSGNPVLEGRGPRMSSGPVNVTVNNAPAGTQAQSRQQQRQGPDGMEMDIIIDLVDAKLAERAGNGRSALGSMLSAQAQQRGLT